MSYTTNVEYNQVKYCLCLLGQQEGFLVSWLASGSFQ